MNGPEVTITWETYQTYVRRLQEAENGEEEYKKRYIDSQKHLKTTEEKIYNCDLELQEEKQKNHFLTAENKFLKEELIRLQEETGTQQRPECSWTWSPEGLVKLALCVGVVTAGAALLAKAFKFI
ncbi:hypothetical protein Q5P01_008339 [Channa striata]|uniref:Uncharacterized protein n=1 Tax=Channa striata TaxID=64152 RepID=A0AA88N6H0_CHASR|nr:hypothetical protein Q5P01_008339 [Channa striata]